MKKLISLLLILLIFITRCSQKIKDTPEVFTKKEAIRIIELFEEKETGYKICGFVGEYNNAYVLNVCYYIENKMELGPAAIYDETIGNYKFTMSLDYTLIVVYNEEIYKIKEAYENNIINDNDLEDIHNKYISIPINNYYLIYEEENKNKTYEVLINEKYDCILVISDLPYLFVASNNGKDVVYINFDHTDLSYIDIKSSESLLSKEEYNILKTYIPNL